MATNRLSGLHARVVAARQEVSHLRAIATDPATLGELADVQQLLDEVAAHFTDEGAIDRPEDVDAALASARRQLHAIHNTVASSRRHAIVEHRARVGS